MLSVSGSFLSRRLTQYVIALIGVVALWSVGAVAQEQHSEISLQGDGFYTRNSNGQGLAQRATDTGGFLVSYRYRLNRWLSARADYGFDRNTQEFFTTSNAAKIRSDAHTATGGFAVSVPVPTRFKIAPYVLAEGGALVFNPNGSPFLPGANRQARGVFVYGGGADFPIVKHISLRAEYRGLVYNAPDFGLKALDTNTITHTAVPSAGVVFRF